MGAHLVQNLDKEAEMPLGKVRQMFVEATGRYDLDAPEPIMGASHYLNAGQRMLDKMLSEGKSVAVYFKNLAAGNMVVTLPKCRVIDEVFLITSTARIQLTKWDVHELRAEYSDATSFLIRGEPANWAPCIIRPYPKTVTANSFVQEWGLDHIVATGHSAFNGILLMPPSDGAYTLEVWGLFWSDVLVNDSDETYWTEEHPEVLLKAAMYQLESMYRNTEGQKDFLDSIKIDLDPLLKDAVEQEQINEMEET